MNMDISLDICQPVIKLYSGVYNILLEGCVSQFFYLGLSFNFMLKHDLRRTSL